MRNIIGVASCLLLCTALAHSRVGIDHASARLRVPSSSPIDLSLTALAETVYSDPIQELCAQSRVLSLARAAESNAVPFLRLSDTTYNWTNSLWVGVDRITYEYNAGGLITGYLFESWNGGAWNGYLKLVIDYLDGDQLFSQTTQTWHGGEWVSQDRLEIVHYSDGLIDTALTQIWTGAEWKVLGRYVYDYAAGQLMSSLVQSWNSGAWTNSSRSSYFYTPTGQIETILHETWNAGAWQNSFRVTYGYDANDLMDLLITQSWQGGDWANTARYDYAYDAAGHQTLFVASNWLNSAWEEFQTDSIKWVGDNAVETVRIHTQADYWERFTHSYDANNNRITDLQEVWNGTELVPVTKQVFVYIEQPCGCLCHADPQCNGAADIVDVVSVIDVAIRGKSAEGDPSVTCPIARADVDCSGLPDIMDVIRVINVTWHAANPVIELCHPCD